MNKETALCLSWFDTVNNLNDRKEMHADQDYEDQLSERVSRKRLVGDASGEREVKWTGRQGYVNKREH